MITHKPKIQRLFAAAAVILTSLMMISTSLHVSAADADSVLNNSEWNDFVEEKMNQDDIPGLSLSMVNGSDTGFRNWGYADISDKTPMTETTPLYIGSCSKAFTALSIMLLQEEGKLSIEDSVADYIPWWHVTFNGKDTDIKIWQLLEHCSGIPNSTMMKIPAGTDDSLFEETVRIAEDLELVREPGSGFEYCNLGYDILAYITQTVSGMPFEDFMKQEIFLPIGMTHSGYDIPSAQGYRRAFCHASPYDAPFYRGGYGDGQIISTAEDMAHWLDAQLGHSDIPEKLANAIKASHEPANGRIFKMNDFGMEYCNGWIHYNGYLYHNGTNPNFASIVIVDTKNDVGIFSDSNIWANTPDYAANSLYQTIKGETINREQLNVPDTCIIMDTVSTALIIICAALMLFIIILLLTQKKRLAKKQTTLRKERLKLCVRLIILLIALALLILIPNAISIVAGYGMLSSVMLTVWMPYTFTIAITMSALTILLAAFLSISRYNKRKNTAS